MPFLPFSHFWGASSSTVGVSPFGSREAGFGASEVKAFRLYNEYPSDTDGRFYLAYGGARTVQRCTTVPLGTGRAPSW